MLIRIAALSFTVCLVTGCSTPINAPLTGNSTQAAKAQALKLDATALAQSPTVAPDRQNQLVNQGFGEGNEAGRRGFASDPNVGVKFYNLTDPAEQKIYIDAYNNGYAQGKAGQPTTTPPTTSSSVSPDRKAELQRLGGQDGRNDAQSNSAANPNRGIFIFGLTDPLEKQIYTAAYNAAYQQSPTTPTSDRLSALKQQGYSEGANDAQLNAPKDPNKGINRLNLVNNAERLAYTNGYNSGYQKIALPITRKRLADLRQQGYNDGDADAKANLPQDPNRGSTLVSLVNATERRAYTNGYNDGYQAFAQQGQSPGSVVLW